MMIGRKEIKKERRRRIEDRVYELGQEAAEMKSNILKLQKATNLICDNSEITTVEKVVRRLLKHLKLDLEFIPESPSTIELIKRSTKK